MASWDMDAAQAERLGAPPSFVLGGETFTCLPAIPAGLVIRPGADGEPVRVTTVDYIRLALRPGDEERFEEVLNARGDLAVDEITLVDLCNRLLEHYTGHPTERPSSSSDGEPPTSPRSKVVSLERGTVDHSDQTATA